MKYRIEMGGIVTENSTTYDSLQGHRSARKPLEIGEQVKVRGDVRDGMVIEQEAKTEAEGI